MAGEIVELPGVDLWCVDSGGTGTPVVFIHAKTGTSESWEPQLRIFAESGYRAIAFDARGRGRSIPRDSGPQPGTAAEDLEALVGAIGIMQFHLVSVAGGAFSALDYAAWRPQRLLSLVAGATLSTFDEPEIGQFGKRIRIEALRVPDQVANLEVGPGYRGANPSGTKRWMEIEAAAAGQGIDRQPLRSPNTYDKFTSISVPVLAIAGGADLIAPPALMRLWVAHVAGAELAVLPEAGHSMAWEDPDAFNSLVLDFIAKHS